MRSTPELCEDHADDVRVVTDLRWASYGGRDRFGGPIATVKCDVGIRRDIDFGVFALGCVPRKSVRRGEGQVDLPVHFGSVTFSPGD